MGRASILSTQFVLEIMTDFNSLCPILLPPRIVGYFHNLFRTDAFKFWPSPATNSTNNICNVISRQAGDFACTLPSYENISMEIRLATSF
jgi:hypothetical protein